MAKPEADIIIVVITLTVVVLIAHCLILHYYLKRSRRLILKEVKEHITVNLLKEFDEHMEKTVRSRRTKSS